MQVWPAIDLRGGQCVRLQQGDYDRETVFSADPADMARQWVAQGARRLHLVDLDGARDGRQANLDGIRAIVAAVGVPCQVGGGIRDDRRIAELLELGVQRLVVGTRAWQDPQWLREACRRHPGCLVLGIDAREGMVATHGWRKTSDLSATDLAGQFAGEPLAAIVYTDIATDGMLAGPNLAALTEMLQAARHPVVASGGITSAADVAAVARLGAAGCIIGRSLYERRLTLADALSAAGDA